MPLSTAVKLYILIIMSITLRSATPVIVEQCILVLFKALPIIWNPTLLETVIPLSNLNSSKFVKLM